MQNNMIDSKPSVVLNADGDDAKNTKNPLNSVGIVVSKATAKWQYDQTVNTLENIDLTVTPGRLVAVIGSVGAGKVRKTPVNVSNRVN